MTNISRDTYTINDDYYRWSIRFFEAVRKRLGLNLKVHPDDGFLKQGHIFLFNHFARFETFIPPYIIHGATGAYSRSVADHGLFEVNERLSKYLRGVGAIPNNQPGLLAFLAAEILRGRKVVMFPEGGMVKDRRVLDRDGNFGVLFPKGKERRKHHRGAAVLAFTLDIFKKRILDLYEKGDEQRIRRWVTALELEDEQQLLKNANEPTLIVPATITFFPIRVQENVLTRTVGLFSGEVPKRTTEELLVEGNLIFRDTDMDIRLNPPIESAKNWRWWDKRLLNGYFRKITSLNDLFGLRDRPEGIAERMLVRRINDQSLQLRDQYMHAIYTGTTVNLSHLSSSIITLLIRQKRMEVNIGHFHRALYLALKSLQTATNVHLHRSLCQPDRYFDLLDGESAELERFLDTCREAGLVARTSGAYRFLDKLCQEFGFHEVRLENPVVVYANEVAPIPNVREAIQEALQKASTIRDKELSSFLFDDEIRAHAWNREHFSQEPYREINDEETATESGAPYLHLPKENIQTGVLLVHGFLASPAELKNFGDCLSKLGYAVMGVRLAGHGTSPWDLKNRTREDWLNSVRRGYRILSAFAGQIVVVGFSTGGALAMMLAAEHPEKLSGVASVSAPHVYLNRKLVFVPLVQGLNKLTDWLPSFEGPMPFRVNESEHPDINYRNIPVHGLYQLRALIEELEDHLVEIKAPALILQGDDDQVVKPDSARLIFDKLTMKDKTLQWVSSGRHGIFNEDIGGTCKFLLDFIKRAGSSAS